MNKVAQRQEEERQENLSGTTKTGQSADGTQEERTFPYDMMISYCHADKELVKQIYEFLSDQGFKIWIDLNNMFGPGTYLSFVNWTSFHFLFSNECYGRRCRII